MFEEDSDADDTESGDLDRNVDAIDGQGAELEGKKSDPFQVSF